MKDERTDSGLSEFEVTAYTKESYKEAVECSRGELPSRYLL